MEIFFPLPLLIADKPFKIDLIVWKYEYGSFIDEKNLKFKIDLIVWK